MKAWLLTPPHPDTRRRRVLRRRIAGIARTFARIPVHRVDVLERLETIRVARVRFRDGAEGWFRFRRLASTRRRFLARWLAIAATADDRSAGKTGRDRRATLDA